MEDKVYDGIVEGRKFRRNHFSLSFRHLNLKELIALFVAALIALFLFYYFRLPFFNIGSTSFYVFMALIIFVFTLFILLFIGEGKKSGSDVYHVWGYDARRKKVYKTQLSANEFFAQKRILKHVASAILIAFVLLIGFYRLIGTKLFQAKAYAKQLNIENAEETELMDTFNYNEGDVLLPGIDKDLAFKLAQASIGDYGSQYTIDYDNFTLISIRRNGQVQLVRIAPLEYSNVFVALKKYNKGSIGYIIVNVVTSETELVELKDGFMKYMPSAVFGRDLARHIRLKYPSAMYNDINFEIDDEGNPYWIIPTYKNKIGVINGAMPEKVIVLNPVNGKSNIYKIGDEPGWVDRTVDFHILEKQTNNALRFKHGFFNVYLGEKLDVFQLSSGYNYFIKDGYTYYVSCITSPNEKDETAIGFVVLNLKTKKATRYAFKGITESRAREISCGDARVKAQKLDATWPILINFNNTETYFIILKNDVQAQKVVFLNCKNGETVAIGDTINDAKAMYEDLLTSSGSIVVEDKTMTVTVEKIRDLGERIEFKVVGMEKYFIVIPDISLDARFLREGDKVTIKYKEHDKYYKVIELTKAGD